MRLKGLLIAVAIGWPFAANSTAFWTGNELYDSCSGADGTPKKTGCITFIIGASDALAEAQIVCLPKGFIVQQAVDIVINFLRDHPELRHYTAASAVAVALKRYACKNSN